MKDKEKLKNLIESVIFCTWDCENLDVDPPVTEKGMTLEETVKVKLPQFEKFIDSLLSSQMKEVLGVIESKRKTLESYHDNDCICLRCLKGRAYNQALDDLKAELSQLAEGKKEI